MIDLHMHTKYSDGTDTIINLLKKCEEKNLEVISITDHNNVMAYFDLEKIKIKEYFSGNIITGCEFTINYKGSMVEILGYGFDYVKINDFLKKYYSPSNINKNSKILYERLICKIKELGFTFNENNFKITEEEFNKGMIEWKIWVELKNYKENFTVLHEDILDNFTKFFREGLTNSNSKLFVNYMEFKPSIKQIIELIHNNGGIVFLAHPFQYKFCETFTLLDEIINNYKIDGIECFHTTFKNSQTKILIEYCRKNNLLISGGSDYHGFNKKNHEIGVGNNNLNIKKDIVNNWDVRYFYESKK